MSICAAQQRTLTKGLRRATSVLGWHSKACSEAAWLSSPYSAFKLSLLNQKTCTAYLAYAVAQALQR